VVYAHNHWRKRSESTRRFITELLEDDDDEAFDDEDGDIILVAKISGAFVLGKGVRGADTAWAPNDRPWVGSSSENRG
jgi:hypothetical protein